MHWFLVSLYSLSFSPANLKHKLIKLWRAFIEGASRTISSAYAIWLTHSSAMWQPIRELSSCVLKLSVYNLYNIGERIPHWRMALEISKYDEIVLPLLIAYFWLECSRTEYHLSIRRSSSFLKYWNVSCDLPYQTPLLHQESRRKRVIQNSDRIQHSRFQH